MQIIGEAISHAKYGKGVVTDKSDRIITVIFQTGEKKFHFPDAFEKHLRLKSKQKQKQINELVGDFVKKREQEENILLQEKKRQTRISALKINENAQAAFGFIANTREQVFSDWTLSTGTYLSGKSKGLPRIPLNMQLNSACLLTACAEGMPEQNRKIIGAFMVNDHFDGKLCQNGVIHGHEKYRIKLTPSEELLFWDYFPETERKTKWGQTEINYFSNKTMKKILQDMKEIVSSEEKKQLLEKFYQYFIKVNKLI